jgi:Na+/melibiose symporter-like transporter
MSEPIFSTSYAKKNQSVLRWISVAIAGVLAVIILIWSAVVSTKDSFKQDVDAEIAREKAEGNGDSLGTSRQLRLMMIGFFFLLVVGSVFLSWFVASLHMFSNNLIAFDVIQIVAIIFLCLASYFWYKTNRSRGASTTFIGCACVLEFVALIVLLASPTTAGDNGVVTQSALYIPLIVSSLCGLAMTANMGRKLTP